MYQFNRAQIHQLIESINNARVRNLANKYYHQRSMSSPLWDNSDYMVSYAIEDSILAECNWILIRKLRSA